MPELPTLPSGEAAAETVLRAAVEESRHRAKTDPNQGLPELAAACAALGDRLREMGDTVQAEKFYCEALDIYKELSARKPAVWEPYTARISGKLGLLLSGTERVKAAEWFHRVAVDTWRKLAEREVRYAPDLAAACQDLAVFLSDTGRAEETERYFRVALDTRRKLAEGNPERYEPEVADTCFALAQYLFQERQEPAKGFFEEAYEIYRRYPRFAEDAERAKRVLDRFFTRTH